MGSENRKHLVAEVALEIRAFQTAVDAFDEAVADRLGINAPTSAAWTCSSATGP